MNLYNYSTKFKSMVFRYTTLRNFFIQLPITHTVLKQNKVQYGESLVTCLQLCGSVLLSGVHVTL